MENMIKVEELFIALDNKDNTIRYEAFKKLIELTNKEVTWAYDYWQTLVDKLSSANSFQRSIGLILLANLTLSDPENKFEDLIEGYLTFFEDEKFITSRQCLQNVWRIAINKEAYKEKIISSLKAAYVGNMHLKRNENLIKQDIIFSLRKISKHYKDNNLSKNIEALIAGENDKKLVKTLQTVQD